MSCCGRSIAAGRSETRFCTVYVAFSNGALKMLVTLKPIELYGLKVVKVLKLGFVRSRGLKLSRKFAYFYAFDLICSSLNR